MKSLDVKEYENVDVNVVKLPTLGGPKGFDISTMSKNFDILQMHQKSDVLINNKNAIQTTDWEVTLWFGNYDGISTPRYRDSAFHGDRILIETWFLYKKHQLYLQENSKDLFRDILPENCKSPDKICWDTFERYGDIVFYYNEPNNVVNCFLYVNWSIYVMSNNMEELRWDNFFHMYDWARVVWNKICIHNQNDSTSKDTSNNTLIVFQMMPDKTLSFISATLLPRDDKRMRYEMNEKGEILLRREDLVAVNSEGGQAIVQSRDNKFFVRAEGRKFEIPSIVTTRDQIKQINFVNNDTITLRYVSEWKQEELAYISVSSSWNIGKNDELFNNLQTD